jgi:hypothetical protein
MIFVGDASFRAATTTLRGRREHTPFALAVPESKKVIEADRLSGADGPIEFKQDDE